MSDWTDGYVAEIDYTHGFYRELTPALMQLAALSRGQFPALAGELTYCELGCGQGYSANLLAAANPYVQVYATDFNPGQIVGAQAMAVEGGVPNIHFSDKSFDEYLVDETLPAFDIIVLHGIYSWISPENRAVIVEFLRRKLKPGGLVYISYNTLPGWAALMPLRRLLVEHAAVDGGPLAERIDRALAFAERLKAADVSYFKLNPATKARLDGLQNMPRNYLAHEYFNRDWSPLYFNEVAQQLGTAKLSYVGSVHLLDEVDTANLLPEQRPVLAEIADPGLRETLRDYMTMQQFRRDLFRRGSVTLPAVEALSHWSNLRLALSAAWPGLSLKVSGALGEATLAPALYGPVLDLLATGPKTVRELQAEPKIAGFGWASLQEIIKVLVGAGWVQPCLPADGDEVRSPGVQRFNAAVMARAVYSGDLLFLASPVTGGGVVVDRVQQLFLLAQSEGDADPAARAWHHLDSQGHSLIKDGKPLEGAEKNLAELRVRYADFVAGYLPVLQRLRIA